ncbi:MAG TPA: hypothetical protein PLD27_06240 [bacterium]|nr:hypothetical protein [bacterium]HOL46842.1 hypothetical protein [bacterium]HPQ18809.1 hypothetical protein [bacterium]
MFFPDKLNYYNFNITHLQNIFPLIAVVFFNNISINDNSIKACESIFDIDFPAVTYFSADEKFIKIFYNFEVKKLNNFFDLHNFDLLFLFSQPVFIKFNFIYKILKHYENNSLDNLSLFYKKENETLKNIDYNNFIIKKDLIKKHQKFNDLIISIQNLISEKKYFICNDIKVYSIDNFLKIKK